ncbi:MAG: hypothetical protein ACOCU6_01835 [Nanoarchaeota archaeon]
MEDQLTKLMETLYNSGLAGSPNEAKRMAQEMLSTSEKVATSSEENQKSNFAVRQIRRKTQERKTSNPEFCSDNPTQQNPESRPQSSSYDARFSGNNSDFSQSNSGSGIEAEKREAYNKEFRDRALSGNPVNVQVDFDTPKSNKYAKQIDSHNYKDQFEASDIPDSHEKLRSSATKQSGFSSSSEFPSAESNGQQHTVPSQDAENKDTSDNNKGFGGSLLDQAIRNVNTYGNDNITPEQYTANNVQNTETHFQTPAQQNTEHRPQNTNPRPQNPETHSQNTAQQNTGPSSQNPEQGHGNGGKRREMTEEEKKKQEEVDLTKHFNFSNRN